MASKQSIPSTLAELRRRADAAATPEERRELLTRGVAFARFTIQERTERAERIFATWNELGRPRLADMPTGTKPQYVGQAQACLDTVAAMSDAEIEELWALPTHEAEDYLGARVKGLGQPKTSFALACTGIGRRGCIDSHIVRNRWDEIEHLLSAQAKRARASRDWTGKRYREAVSILWGPGDTAAAQWTEWLENYVTDTDHNVLLDA